MAAAAGSPSRGHLVYIAQLSERTHRYEDMLQAMSAVAEFGTGLTRLERELFSRAYHSVTDEKCTAWHILASSQLLEREKGNLKAEKAAIEFRLKVESEIEEASYLVINTIDRLLRVSSSSAENLVFYHHMKGKCYMTLAKVKDATLGLKKENCYGTFAELKDRAARLQASEQLLKAYELAREVAMVNLCPTNPIRLALALDVSDFFNQLMRSPERAYQVAKQAVDDAESVSGGSKEASMQTKDLMGNFRDRLTHWNYSTEKGDDEGNEIEYKDADDTALSSKQQTDECVVDQEEKLEETEEMPELNNEDEERYRTARYMSGKNMTRAQKMIWCALDRCMKKKTPK